MYLIRGLLVLCIFAGQNVICKADKNGSSIYTTKWKCETLCRGTGSKVEFDPKTELCRCTPHGKMDDIEQEVIRKNAQVVGLNFIMNPTKTESDKKVVKREVVAAPQRKANSITGQRPTQKTLASKTPAPFRTISTGRKPTTPRSKRTTASVIRKGTVTKSPVTVQQRLQEIQTRINDRRKNKGKDLLGASLQQRSSFQEETSNVMERLKEKQKELQEKLKVKKQSKDESESLRKTQSEIRKGSNTEAVQKEGGKTVRKEPIPHEKSEVITQDPSLYENNL